MNGHDSTDHAAVHGMLIVGESRVYLSHLPMFRSPHDFQAIFEVRLQDSDGDVAAHYQQDRRASGEPVYTWVPKPFSLPGLFTASGGMARMQGTIFRGHFERGGTPITSSDIQAEVTRVLFARKFVPSEPAPRSLQYLLFGDQSEPFVAHVITRPPDYDHVLSVTLSKAPLKWDGKAVVLEFRRRFNTHDQRLTEGEILDPVVLPGSAPLNLSVERELYRETSDLAS